MSDYNFAYLERARPKHDPPRDLKVFGDPGYQVPLPAARCRCLMVGHGRVQVSAA